MFSVLIATRDRPELLVRALRSVAVQTYREFDLVVVDDSGTDETRERNRAVVEANAPGCQIVLTGGHCGLGPGAARNVAIRTATRDYLAFLDDDDEWIDPEYLHRAAAAIARYRFDLLFADQLAQRPDGSVVAGPVWAEDLAVTLPAQGVVPTDGLFLLTAEQTLLSDGFAHLNTTIIRRQFAAQLGGFDPAIRYEEDRDFYLRAIDAAGSIGYLPLVVARHHVPDGRSSASSISIEQREACRLAVLGKAAAGAKHGAIRERCRRDRSVVLKRASLRAAAAGELELAVERGRAALRDRWGWKWAAVLAGLYARRAVQRRSKPA